MPLPSEVRERVRAFLEPGEQVHYVFPAEITLSAQPCVIVVVSDRAVTVLSTGWRSRRHPRSMVARYPRQVRFGPVELGSPPEFTLRGIRYQVDEEYVSVLNTADAELAAEFLPADPLPDL